ncbi:MAG: hypothetical protein ACLSTO_12755 [Bilophila wadsworthia]
MRGDHAPTFSPCRGRGRRRRYVDAAISAKRLSIVREHGFLSPKPNARHPHRRRPRRGHRFSCG